MLPWGFPIPDLRIKTSIAFEKSPSPPERIPSPYPPNFVEPNTRKCYQRSSMPIRSKTSYKPIVPRAQHDAWIQQLQEVPNQVAFEEPSLSPKRIPTPYPLDKAKTNPKQRYQRLATPDSSQPIGLQTQCDPWIQRLQKVTKQINFKESPSPPEPTPTLYHLKVEKTGTKQNYQRSSTPIRSLFPSQPIVPRSQYDLWVQQLQKVPKQIAFKKSPSPPKQILSPYPANFVKRKTQQRYQRTSTPNCSPTSSQPIVARTQYDVWIQKLQEAPKQVSTKRSSSPPECIPIRNPHNLVKTTPKSCYQRSSTPTGSPTSTDLATQDSAYDTWVQHLHGVPKAILVRGTNHVLPGIIAGHLVSIPNAPCEPNRGWVPFIKQKLKKAGCFGRDSLLEPENLKKNVKQVENCTNHCDKCHEHQCKSSSKVSHHYHVVINCYHCPSEQSCFKPFHRRLDT